MTRVIHRLRLWHHHRRLIRRLPRTARQPRAMPSRTWLLAEPTSALWTARVAEMEEWLAQQWHALTDPTGLNHVNIGFVLVDWHDQRRAYRWHTLLPSRPVAERAAALQAARDQLAALPLTQYPNATHVEVYLVNLGGLVANTISELAGGDDSDGRAADALPSRTD